jgi:hypothetical protein
MTNSRKPDVLKAVPRDVLRARVAVVDHVRWTGDGDGYVLLDLEQGRYHSLDGVSARIWTGLLAGSSPEKTAAEIAELCHVPLERVGRDVAGFVASLAAKGLVRIDG